MSLEVVDLGIFPKQNLRFKIVENEVPAIRCNGQNGMTSTVGIQRDGYQECGCRKAQFDEAPLVKEDIVLAITFSRKIDVPDSVPP